MESVGRALGQTQKSVWSDPRATGTGRARPTRARPDTIMHRLPFAHTGTGRHETRHDKTTKLYLLRKIDQCGSSADDQCAVEPIRLRSRTSR
eukprot:4928944-Prymnesium_polylepis.1